MSKPVTSVGGIDFKRVFIKYAKNWYIFAIAIMLAYAYASNKNKYIVPIYSMKTSVLIEDKSNTSVLEQRGAISASPIYLSSKLIDNQIAFLKSFAQIKRIIQNLDFEVSYFSKEKYIYSEIYTQSPFVVWFDRDHWQPRYQQIRVKFLSPTKFQLSSDNGPFDTPKTFNVGDTIQKKEYCFVINLKDETDASEIQNKEFAFEINDLNGLVGKYMNSTNVYIERGTSMIIISSNGPNKQKEKDYLNQLTTEFLLSNLEKKNKILTNTINFIEKQLLQFRKDLNDTEQEIEEFRKKHNFMMLQEKIGSLLKNLDEESKDSKNLRIDLEYYRYLLTYIEEREDYEDIVMPSSMGVNLPMFNAQVGKLALAIQDKNTLLSNSTRSNPYLQILERDIAVMKVACAESMKSTIETTELKLANTEQRMWSLNQEFMKLPRLEREFLTIQRKYKIINDLYDFLLKRKSEVEIQRAANTPDHEIVDFAGDTGISKISPGPKTAYINSMIWAILLPAVFLFMLVFFNNRVMALEDITSNTDIPVIGTLMRNPEKGVSSVLKSPNSYFTELLRIIRIKLNFNPANGEQVIMVTSAMEQEGKAFFALNFASVYALTGKKTIYLGFNLRRQRVPSDFDLDPGIGITDYLITDLHINTVIQKTFTKNLDILLSGPIPPNPDELIESEKTRLLFQELRKRYDYIVVETPPIGLVGDAYLLNRYSDATIFIVRYNFSTKKGFSDTLIEATHNEMKKIGIVYNDVRMKISSRDLSFYGEALKPKYRIMPLFIRIRRIIVDLLRKI
jgi:capsular exopolysaccharide synthesis family protein